ncbi:MAG TPA: hypothetical protein VK817_09005, partial [Trebonia sp.]|nr:hypothetical protein [Trebonia sp.]
PNQLFCAFEPAIVGPNTHLSTLSGEIECAFEHANIRASRTQKQRVPRSTRAVLARSLEV